MRPKFRSYFFAFSARYAGLLVPVTVLFVYQKQGANSMKKIDYEKAINEAKNKAN